MCEKKTGKITKCSHTLLAHEMRRQRRRAAPARAVVVTATPAALAPPVGRPAADHQAQGRLILELALKTIFLMKKNNLIQQKLVALRKETAEFMASVMSNPENKKRYLEHVSLYGGKLA